MKKKYDQGLQDDPSFLKKAVAKVVTSALDLVAAASDVLELGEGAAAGGWGWAEDAFRLMDIIDITQGVGHLARAGIRAIAASGGRRVASSLEMHRAEVLTRRIAAQGDEVGKLALRQSDDAAKLMRRETDDLVQWPTNRVDADDAIDPGCPINSFAGDTPVATADGLKPIEEIAAGDPVLAFDEISGATGFYTVTATLKHVDSVLVLLTLEDRVIETTPAHPFYTAEGGWIAAGNLAAGDRIRKSDGEAGVVLKVETVERNEEVYNLAVADAHTFFVGDANGRPQLVCGKHNAYKEESQLRPQQDRLSSRWLDDFHLEVRRDRDLQQSGSA